MSTAVTPSSPGRPVRPGGPTPPAGREAGSAPGAAAASGSARAQARVASWYLWVQLYLAAWFWGIGLALIVVVTLVLSRFGELDRSVVALAHSPAVWFPFAMAIVSVTSMLAVHVASGGTRRTFLRGQLAATAATALVYAALFTAALWIEGRVYDARGWTQEVGSSRLFTDSSEVGLVALDHALVFLAAGIGGLLVGISYYRARGLLGTLLLPATVGPVVLVSELVGRTSGDWIEWAGLGSTPARALVSLAVIVALGVAFAAATRRVPIKPLSS